MWAFPTSFTHYGLWREKIKLFQKNQIRENKPHLSWYLWGIGWHGSQRNLTIAVKLLPETPSEVFEYCKRPTTTASHKKTIRQTQESRLIDICYSPYQRKWFNYGTSTLKRTNYSPINREKSESDKSSKLFLSCHTKRWTKINLWKTKKQK